MAETSSSNHTHAFRNGASLPFYCSEAREWDDEAGVPIGLGVCRHYRDASGWPLTVQTDTRPGGWFADGR